MTNQGFRAPQVQWDSGATEVIRRARGSPGRYPLAWSTTGPSLHEVEQYGLCGPRRRARWPSPAPRFSGAPESHAAHRPAPRRACGASRLVNRQRSAWGGGPVILSDIPRGTTLHGQTTPSRPRRRGHVGGAAHRRPGPQRGTQARPRRPWRSGARMRCLAIGTHSERDEDPHGDATTRRHRHGARRPVPTCCTHNEIVAAETRQRQAAHRSQDGPGSSSTLTRGV
jgi:hypothetical protein